MPTLLNAILVLIGAELVAIIGALWLKHRLDLVMPVFFFLLSGACLMGLLRLSLNGQSNAAIALTLLGLSFVGHIAALGLTWRLVQHRDK